MNATIKKDNAVLHENISDFYCGDLSCCKIRLKA